MSTYFQHAQNGRSRGSPTSPKVERRPHSRRRPQPDHLHHPQRRPIAGMALQDATEPNVVQTPVGGIGECGSAECAVCMNVLVEPCPCPRGHLFCRVCIDRWGEEVRRRGRALSCPLCRVRMNHEAPRTSSLSRTSQADSQTARSTRANRWTSTLDLQRPSHHDAYESRYIRYPRNVHGRPFREIERARAEHAHRPSAPQPSVRAETPAERRQRELHGPNPLSWHAR
jgi:hypothetical protein